MEDKDKDSIRQMRDLLNKILNKEIPAPGEAFKKLNKNMVKSKEIFDHVFGGKDWTDNWMQYAQAGSDICILLSSQKLRDNLVELTNFIFCAVRLFYFCGYIAGETESEIKSLESMLNVKENKDTELPKS